jgi:anti-sigma regulatory factor (Ser/Thr protein kinase)
MPGVELATTLDRLVARLSPGPSPQIHWGERLPLRATACEGVLVDLADVAFATPTLALRLAASAVVHDAAGTDFQVIPPVSRRVCRYLARAGLSEVLGVAEQPPGADMLLPITRIAHPEDVEQAGERLQSALTSELSRRLVPYSDALMLALSELCDNACSHGKSEHGAFMMAHRKGQNQVLLAVGDLGVGIPEHLSSALHGTLQRGEEGRLIAQALQPGVSGASVDRGNGLPRIIETVRELKLPQAELAIWSGTGRITARLGGVHERRPRVVGCDTPGAWVEIVLASSQRDTRSRSV